MTENFLNFENEQQKYRIKNKANKCHRRQPGTEKILVI